jgi:DNA-binding LacI/PurR family transcriptional regulator
MLGTRALQVSVFFRDISGALERRGLSADFELLEDRREGAVALAVHRLFNRPRPATAIVSMYTDVHAALRELDHCSLKVPDDVSVCSVMDDPEIDAFIRPRLASLRVDIPAMGRYAADALCRWIEDQEQPVNVALPITEFADAESIGMAPGQQKTRVD